MIETATGLVLRTYPLTETSLIVHWLTPELGRLATVAKGARGPKSPFRGKLDLFYLADFSFNRSRRSELHTLREVMVRETHASFRRELSYLRQAAYCAALVESATETETPLPAIFEMLKGVFLALPLAPARPQTVFAFELKLLSELGLEPDLARTQLGSEAAALVRVLQEADWKALSAVEIQPPQVAELKRFLQGFLAYHLGRLPKGRDAALS